MFLSTICIITINNNANDYDFNYVVSCFRVFQLYCSVITWKENSSFGTSWLGDMHMHNIDGQK